MSIRYEGKIVVDLFAQYGNGAKVSSTSGWKVYERNIPDYDGQRLTRTTDGKHLPWIEGLPDCFNIVVVRQLLPNAAKNGRSKRGKRKRNEVKV